MPVLVPYVLDGGEADVKVDIVVAMGVLVVSTVDFVFVSVSCVIEAVDVRLVPVEMGVELADAELGLVPEGGAELGALPPARLRARGFPSHG